MTAAHEIRVQTRGKRKRDNREKTARGRLRERNKNIDNLQAVRGIIVIDDIPCHHGATRSQLAGAIKELHRASSVFSSDILL